MTSKKYKKIQTWIAEGCPEPAPYGIVCQTEREEIRRSPDGKRLVRIFRESASPKKRS